MPETSSMPPAERKPLLTLAIPTYNRAGELREMLRVLEPQLRNRPEIDLYLSDNASPDETEATIRGFIEGGMAIRYHRHPVNVGSDANFVSCFHNARGRYFWLFGDDDIILPGTIDEVMHHLGGDRPAEEEFDIVYVTSYGFREDYVAERAVDPLQRRFHTITDPLHFVRVVNTMLTFISGIIVNRERLLDLPRVAGFAVEDPSAFLSTNLTQLSWTLPLLRAHRRSLVLWDRPIAGRQGNSGGYSVGHIFGQSLVDTCRRLLPDRPELASGITDFVVRRWFPGALYEIRATGNRKFAIEDAHTALKRAYGDNFRYWLFAYPVLRLPLPLARLWVKGGVVFSKLAYMLLVPTFWRREI